MTVRAFSPGSVTCFFQPGRDQRTGLPVSRGCAINLKQGVTGQVGESAATEVWLNDSPIDLPPVTRLLEQLAPRPVRVTLETPLEIGCGFGVSGSAALVTALGLNRLFQLQRTRGQLGLLAHEAEVACGTGLGDVATQLCGGVVFRSCDSGPLDCRRLDLPPVPLRYRVFGPIDTAGILAQPALVERLRTEGRAAIEWLADREAVDNLSLVDILGRARSFCERTQVLSDLRVRNAIAEAEQQGDAASMILLGHSVLATGNSSVGDAENKSWIPCDIDIAGTRYLE